MATQPQALDGGQLQTVVAWLEDPLREAREQVAQAAERADQQSQQIPQTLLLRAADAERDRKQVGDLLGQIAKLEDALQALEGRARVVADEARRDRGRIQELPN